MNSKPLPQAPFLRVIRLPDSAYLDPVLKAQLVCHVSSPFGEGFNYNMHSKTHLPFNYGMKLLRTQMTSTSSIERFLVTFDCHSTG